MNIRPIPTSIALFGSVLLMFSAQTALADHNCKKVHGRADFSNPLGEPNCIVGNEAFDFCFSGQVRGSLRGSWTAYGFGDWFVPLNAPDFPVPDETLSNYNREFNVFTTRRGTLFGDSQYVFDTRIFDVGGGFVSPIIIEGGTGIYQGATGWIAGVFTDAEISTAKLVGEVCGPYIPAARRDEDEGDD